MNPTRERWQRRLGIGVFASWLALDAILITGTSLYAQWASVSRNIGPTDEWVAIVLTLLFAQIGFAALWLVFGPGSLAIRLPALVGNLIISTAAFFRFVADDGALEIRLLWYFLALFGGFQIAVLVPLVAIRRYVGFQAAWYDELPTDRSQQFGLIHLFVWMFGAAVLTEVIRRVLGELKLNDNFIVEPKDFFALGQMVVMGMIQPLLAGCALVRPATVKAWLYLAGGSLCCSAVVAAPSLLYANPLDAIVLTVIFFGQFVLLSFYLALLRLAGLRVVCR